MRKCLICGDDLPLRSLGRPPKRTRRTCSAACRKRLQRARASGKAPRLLLRGQQELTGTSAEDLGDAALTNRQPQDRP